MSLFLCWNVITIFTMASKETDIEFDGYSTKEIADKANDYCGGGGGVDAGRDIMEGQQQQQVQEQPTEYTGDVDGFMYGINSGNPVALMGEVHEAVDMGGGAASNSNAFTAFTQAEAMAPPIEMATSFTASQWQELERQTMMYKYMMASVPVSSELQLPVSVNSSIKKFAPYANNASPTQSNTSLESGISSFSNSSNQDPEPWRCKRTDGKKWRCSRDVAPDQKYCERHSHKSRPRSRKPVELQTKISNPDTSAAISNSEYSNSLVARNLSLFPGTMPSLDHPRSLGWFLKGETTAPVVSNTSQGWQLLGKESFKVHDHIPAAHQTNARGGYFQSQCSRLDEQCSQIFAPNSTTSSQETMQAIDAWSLPLRNQDGSRVLPSMHEPASSDMLFPLSSIKLTASGSSDQTTEGSEDIQGCSLGVVELETEIIGAGMDDGSHNWMCGGADGSWMDSPPGGPLAEALCVGISSSSSRSASSSSSSSASASVSGLPSRANFAKKS